jgi:hypothetical protein
MNNFHLNSDESINGISMADLEALIIEMVEKVLKKEDSMIFQSQHPPKAFLDTFGSWEDTRTVEEIVDDIYSSRTIS